MSSHSLKEKKQLAFELFVEKTELFKKLAEETDPDIIEVFACKESIKNLASFLSDIMEEEKEEKKKLRM